MESNVLELVGVACHLTRRESGVCPKHGDYSVLLLPGQPAFCPECVAEKLREEDADCSRAEEEVRRAARLRAAGITERFAGCSFENYELSDDAEQRKAFTAAKSYAKNFGIARQDGAGMIFVGTPGTGKNHLAVAIIKSIGEQGFSGRIIRLGDMVREIREAWNTPEGDAPVIERLVSLDLLVIDEVGLSHGTDDEKLQFNRVLNARYERCRPVILISNLSPDELVAEFGERVFDRLRDRGGIIVPFAWESYRAQTQRRWLDERLDENV